MSPTNLGDLASNRAASTGLLQVKRGALENSIVIGNYVGVSPLTDGQGVAMRIALKPPRRGWWLIHAQNLWMQVDPVWSSWEWGVDLNIADLDGRQRFRTQSSWHSACSWQTSSVDALFKVEDNVDYNATMTWLYSSGYNQRYHNNPYYQFIEGEFIEDGTL